MCAAAAAAAVRNSQVNGSEKEKKVDRDLWGLLGAADFEAAARGNMVLERL